MKNTAALVRTFFLVGMVIVLATAARAQDATITVQADHVLHSLSPWLTGACIEDVNHEIYGGIYSQMIFGESFQEPPQNHVQISGMWDAVRGGSATGNCSLEMANPFVGAQSQRLSFTGGAGEFGIANRGLNRWGLSFLKGKSYDGHLEVRTDVPAELWVALESTDGSRVYAERRLMVSGNGWRRLDFTLKPSANDTNGRFVIELKQPGSVVLGYAFLEPGAWGRFHGLPVRKDVAEGLVRAGITVLRYGGSMVNAPEYHWSHMTGPRDRRPPYDGHWYRYSTDGWAIPDFLDFCEAAHFLGVPDININESLDDITKLIQYVNGPATSPGGAQRVADGHRKPYGLRYIELGNEERVDDSYFQKFKPLAETIWALDTNITIVVGDFAYSHTITDAFNFDGADSHITTLEAQQKILRLAKQHGRAVWFDLHVNTDGPTPGPSLAGMFSYDDAMRQIADGADYRVLVFELNAGNHSQRRALANALALNAAARDGRLPIVTSANCLQPDGQNDNGWDQGLLFLNPSQVWLQPPGYVTQMFSRHYEPLEVASAATGDLDVSAERSKDDCTLILRVVNASGALKTAAINVSGFAAERSTVEQLAGPLDAVNTAQAPDNIKAVPAPEIHFTNGKAPYAFPPYSVTVITLQ